MNTLLRPALLAGILLLLTLPAAAQSNDFLISADDVAKDPKLVPAEVVLKKKTQVSLPVGSVVFEAGARLNVIRADRDNVYVRVANSVQPVPIADTNLLETVNASFSVARLRQRLIDDANALPEPRDGLSTPAPTPTPAAAPTPTPVVAQTTPRPAATSLNNQVIYADEFSDTDALDRWKRLTETEEWHINTMELEQVMMGRLILQPYTQAWWDDYRGELFYQTVEGDFEVKTLVGAFRRAEDNPPSRPFSMVGLMVRYPRKITPQTWSPGGENYIFIGVGVGENPSRVVCETKVTVQSKSNKQELPLDSPTATLKIVHLGAHYLLLLKPAGGAPWQLLQNLQADGAGNVPVQVGFTAYADYQAASSVTPVEHNSTVLKGGSPDLRAVFEYVRITRPEVTVDAIANAAPADIVRLFGK